MEVKMAGLFNLPVVDPVQRETEGEDRLTVSLTEYSGAHALLKAVYMDNDQPLTRRIRCAIAAIPYEVGKLTASTPSGQGRGFASQLEAARKRSREALVIEHQSADDADADREREVG
jgi:hypothetical protein